MIDANLKLMIFDLCINKYGAVTSDSPLGADLTLHHLILLQTFRRSMMTIIQLISNAVFLHYPSWSNYVDSYNICK